MLTRNNETIIIKNNHQEEWYVVDATNKKLGRLTSQIAYILRGKNKTKYLEYTLNNTKIIIINSRNIIVTGKKNKQKTYKRHSGRPGSLKTESFETLNKRAPNKIIEKAIKGMLPKNSLGRQLFKQVKVYEDSKHPHRSQKPIFLDIN
uniref:Large ribosomal subunit protein uL13c n=1 Tax=Digenea simplex TaxID=945030 RepID=A0A1Z1MUF6_DIGSM|nr:ribosomal protein L13 [Digenea simplex]ARW69596.1 ribosomal protein L13 [Digenea simplex]